MRSSLKSKKLWVGAAAVLLAAFVLCAAAQAAPPIVKDAEKALAKAEAAEKAGKYDAALAQYKRIEKEFKGSQFAAEALFREAKIQARTKKTRYQAYETARRMIREYRTAGYPVVEQAKVFKEQIAREIDNENSKHILYKVMDFFVALTGRRRWSYWIAIILITTVVRVLTWPMQKMQFKAMRDMQRVQPLIKDLQKKYKDNQQEVGRKVMELYKEHKVNPFASCLPLLIQLPVLWALYYTIRLYEFQFAKGTFLWIGSSLSHHTQLIAASLAERDIPLVVIYTISMYVTQKLTPVDPTQAEQQKMMSIMMPLMFGYLFGVLYEFPSAFMLYWLVFNVMQIIQQYFALKTPTPAEAPVAAASEPVVQRRPRPRRRRR